MPDFVPRKDVDLLFWSKSLSERLAANPQWYGLTLSQIATLAAAHADYDAAYRRAHDPMTRTRINIIEKDEARRALVAEVRALVRIVQATPEVTTAQKADLGITRRDVKPTRLAPPSSMPFLHVKEVRGRRITLTVRDLDAGDRRGKPRGVAGAAIYSFVGEEASQSLRDWTFEGNATRDTFEIGLPASVPSGSAVWLAACWFNPRSQRGPISTPILTHIAGGIAKGTPALRLVA